MVYLTIDDYKAQIKDDILTRILEGDDNLRLDAEKKAVAQAQSRLNVRYDVQNIFNKTGEDRNYELVMYLVDMSLYHIHSRINPGQVPELRMNRYQDAMDWLKNVGAGDWNPGFPGKGDADEDGRDDGEGVQWGSSTPRNPYF